ncbi:hypothetical protein [Arthrobacter sp. FB24]|uniref:hypothetical protein n=1 Tax=Arthrobacter sp. (strain FB24) TaxID=290399 RepID=UPI0001E13BA1|nr:hypothetical protein [Arthrobacter sp. FB24]
MAFRLRDFIGRRRTPAAAESFPAAAPVEDGRPELGPAELADLEEAWAELRQAAQEAGVRSFRACTRDGSRWEENLDSVRAMTRTIKGIEKDTDEGAKGL